MNDNEPDAGGRWTARYREIAESLPPHATLSALALFGASTHGTRTLECVVRWFDRELGPRGWDIDATRTHIDTWTGDGMLAVRRDNVTCSFPISGDFARPHAERLASAAAALLADPVIRPRIRREFRPPAAPPQPQPAAPEGTVMAFGIHWGVRWQVRAMMEPNPRDPRNPRRFRTIIDGRPDLRAWTVDAGEQSAKDHIGTSQRELARVAMEHLRHRMGLRRGMGSLEVGSTDDGPVIRFTLTDGSPLDRERFPKEFEGIRVEEKEATPDAAPEGPAIR